MNQRGRERRIHFKSRDPVSERSMTRIPSLPSSLLITKLLGVVYSEYILLCCVSPSFFSTQVSGMSTVLPTNHLPLLAWWRERWMNEEEEGWKKERSHSKPIKSKECWKEGMKPVQSTNRPTNQRKVERGKETKRDTQVHLYLHRGMVMRISNPSLSHSLSHVVVVKMTVISSFIALVPPSSYLSTLWIWHWGFFHWQFYFL